MSEPETPDGPIAAPSLDGAVAWLNVLTLRRRLRMVVGVLVTMLLVMVFSGVRADARAGQGLPMANSPFSARSASTHTRHGWCR